LFSALTVLPIYGIARRTFSSGVAAGAAWAWAVLPASMYFPIVWIWDTSLIALLFAMIFCATLKMRDAQSTSAWVGYGALWALGVLVNPSILSVFPFLLGWLLWESRREAAPWLKFGLATILVFGLALVPWTVRNYRVFGKFMVLRS